MILLGNTKHGGKRLMYKQKCPPIAASNLKKQDVRRLPSSHVVALNFPAIHYPQPFLGLVQVALLQWDKYTQTSKGGAK